jgi:GTPase SAR1 family protein
MKTANPELKLAEDFIRDTGCHIFLTGKAGTGKTTFLRKLKKESNKRLIVAAPTGVAAINAGGVTLHSFFQLPFGPFIPGNGLTRYQYRFSREKLNIIKSLDLLIIDEISMVRADLLDGVDSVLRRFRRSSMPFGGVQLLMIGDLFQLPPVVKDDEWTLLHQYYETPYFFSSTALSRTEMVTIELQRIFRQADSRFIDLLNQVREDSLSQSALAALNQRHIPNFSPAGNERYITLCTHNRNADSINASRLGELTEKIHRFEAEVEGDFPEHAYPTAATLALKPGAQVMFVRNDLSPEKRYFNGKMGTIIGVTGKKIKIQCPKDDNSITVEPVTWENIAYALNPETQEITEKKIGAFTQFPLRLAWAITIHKSQGLTFDRAIIDAQAAFAHGQVYVALSRCRTIDGMVLSTPLVSKAIKTDAAVRRFSDASKQNRPTSAQLSAEKKRHQQHLLLDCFDFKRLRNLLGRMTGLVLGNQQRLYVTGVEDLRKLQETTEDEICSVGAKFQRQLQGLFATGKLPADDPAVLERISKASAYFKEKIDSEIGHGLHQIQIETDNQAIAKKVNRALQQLREEIAVKLAAIQSCEHGFSPSQYYRAVSGAAIDTGPAQKKTRTAAYSEADIAHPELFQELKTWRAQKAKQEEVAHYQVLHQKTLVQIAVNLPDNLPAIKGIRGIGERLAERYGEELIAIVGAYRRRNQIKEVVLPVPKPAERHHAQPRSETRQISLDLFSQGLSLDQIAASRELARSTIEGHMFYWVATGKVAIDALIPAKKLDTIKQTLAQMPDTPLGKIKRALGDDVSYGEIKLVQAHLKDAADRLD